MDHLRAGGHTQIGFFGLCREMSWARSRFSAYVESLMRLGMNFEPRNVFENSLEEAMSPTTFDCRDQIKAVINRKNAGVDAWVCASSVIGYSLCRGFLNAGLRIPEDVAVAGYHQNKKFPTELPSMTSTAVADEELGAAALRRLLHRFSHPDESQRSVLLPASFVQGVTTTPASRRRRCLTVNDGKFRNVWPYHGLAARKCICNALYLPSKRDEVMKSGAVICSINRVFSCRNECMDNRNFMKWICGDFLVKLRALHG